MLIRYARRASAIGGLSVVFAMTTALPATALDFVTCARDIEVPQGTRVECATHAVPEDHEAPQSRLIDLPLVRLSTGTSGSTPIYLLNGGPGGTNLAFGLPTSRLLAAHPVVLVGYRGVDDPQPLECPETSAAMVEPEPLSAVGRQRLGEAAAACARRLRAAGIDLAHYTMFDVIHDLESVRQALDQPSIHLLARSYGTRIAGYYTRLHPNVIDRAALVTVNPPGHFKWFPEATDAVIARYTAHCRADPNCASRTNNLGNALLQAVSREDLTWLGLAIDQQKVWATAFMLLTNRSTSALVFDAAIAAEQGDHSGLWLLGMAYDLFMPGAFVMGDMLAKAGAECDSSDRFVTQRAITASSFGSPMDLLLQGACASWPIAPWPDGFDRPAVVSTPTLLVNGNLDLSTPLRYVEEKSLPYFVNGELVTLEGFGHGDWTDRQISALDHMLTTFFATGRVDSSRYAPEPVDFDVSWSLTTIAKAGVAALAVAALLLAWLIVAVLRKLRRRSA